MTIVYCCSRLSVDMLINTESQRRIARSSSWAINYNDRDNDNDEYVVGCGDDDEDVVADEDVDEDVVGDGDDDCRGG